MSHLNFSILAFSTNFCPIKIDLSGNTIFEKDAKFFRPKEGVYTVFENHRKKSHSTLRAKRATFTKVYQKCQKWSTLASLRSNSVTRQVNFNRTKIGEKCQNAKNLNATF